jgi:hypothetical protein
MDSEGFESGDYFFRLFVRSSSFAGLAIVTIVAKHVTVCLTDLI